MLKEIYLSTIKKYSSDESYNAHCWSILEGLYTSENRYYHNLTHLESIISHSEKLKEHIEDYDSFLFSIFYHDAIYDPLKNDNEIQSALLLQEHLSKTDFGDIDKCMKLIESTASHVANGSSDSHLFLDIDLSILGESWSTYQTYMANIRKEYGHLSDEQYADGRVKVLNSFIERESIYKTEYFKEIYEVQTRSNIAREIEVLISKSLYLLYCQFEQADESEQECHKKKIQELFATIKKPSVEDFHIVGIVHYELAKNDNEIEEAHHYFKQALKLDGTCVISRLYSAHCYHDLQKLDLALQEYLLVDQGRVKDEFHLWRVVKLKEQIGYCYYKTGYVEEACSYFEEVVAYYRNNDLSDLVNPQEIYECLNDDHSLVKELREIENEYNER